MSSGGSKTPSNTTSTQTTIPKFAEPYAMDMLGRNQALNQTGYQQYEGQRLAGFTPMQEQGFNNVYNMQTSPQTSAASGIAALAGQRAMGMSYNPSNLQQYQMNAPQQVGSQTFNSQAAQDYMSPYMQNVVDSQQREAVRQSDIAGTKRGFNAATSGAFGGSRHAIENSEAQRNLGMQLGDIQAKGLQDAYSQAQTQFNADQGRGLQAGISNQQAGLSAAGQNLNALLGVQQLSEEAKQFGAKYGLDALSSMLQASNQLGQLGTDQYNQRMGITQAQLDAGGQQQGLEQAYRDTQYQDFLDRLNFPYKQMSLTSDLLHGLPTNETRNVYGYPNTAAQTTGNLAGLAGLYMSGQKGG